MVDLLARDGAGRAELRRGLLLARRHRVELLLWPLAAVAVLGARQSAGAYLLALAFAARVSWASPAAAVALPLCWLAAAGTELRPDMLGLGGPQVRLFDFVLLGSAVGVVRGPPPARPWVGASLLLAALAVSVATLAFGLGEPAAAAAAAHQVAVAVAGYLVARRLVSRPGGSEALLWIFVLAGALAGAKALALWGAGIDVTGGPNSALQAVSRIEPVVFARRTILTGGAMICVLAVPVTLALLFRAGRTERWLAPLVLLPLGAVLVSLTRASMLGAIAGAVLVVLVARSGREANLRHVVTIVAAAWIGALALTWQASDSPWSSVVARFGSDQARATSLGFREREAEAVVDALDGTQWITGLGLGGRFELVAAGTNPEGNSYAHAWPLWLLLKGGVVGLLLATAGYVAILWRLLIRPVDAQPARRALGAAFAALLVSSLAVNSFPLAEGNLVLGFFAAAAGVASAGAVRRAPRGTSAPSARPLVAR